MVLPFSPNITFAQTTAIQKAKEDLERELIKLEAEIREQELLLLDQKNNSGTIQDEIEVLRGKINKTRLEISKKNTEIQKISGEISQREEKITQLQDKEERQKALLAELLKRVRHAGDASVWEFVLSNTQLSDFFEVIDDVESINRDIQESFYDIRFTKVVTSEEKETLNKQKIEQEDIKKELEYNRQTVERQEDQQEVLLNDSQTKEKSFEEIIADREIKAAQIRASLFELVGLLKGAQGIPFGQALEYAEIAGSKTGVRAAFILAILQQESSLGKNVGTCNRPGDTRTWKTIMPGPVEYSSGRSWRDDQSAFQRIASKLGISPDGQPLSCPLGSGGWGGAMGPSQFIPTTWESYESRVAVAVGVSLADPWNPLHAVMATALYTADLGAGVGGYTAEREAACKYYSGRGCSDPAVKNAFYGDAVLSHATSIQQNIDILNQE